MAKWRQVTIVTNGPTLTSHRPEQGLAGDFSEEVIVTAEPVEEVFI